MNFETKYELNVSEAKLSEMKPGQQCRVIKTGLNAFGMGDTVTFTGEIVSPNYRFRGVYLNNFILQWLAPDEFEVIP